VSFVHHPGIIIHFISPERNLGLIMACEPGGPLSDYLPFAHPLGPKSSGILLFITANTIHIKYWIQGPLFITSAYD